MSSRETVPFVVALVTGLLVFFLLLSTSTDFTARRVTGQAVSAVQGVSSMLFFGVTAIVFIALFYAVVWMVSEHGVIKESRWR